MKIAHLISQFYPVLGGAEICVHNVCSQLAAAGHQATVVTTIHPAPDKPVLDYSIVHLSPHTNGLFRRAPFLARLYLTWKLAQLQRRHQFDLWQVTMGYPLGALAVDFFRKSGVPCVLRCCGEDIQKYPEINYGYRLDPVADALARRQYPKFDGFVALTPSVRDEYFALGIPESKIRVIPNGVDLARFRSARRDDALRRELGADEATKLIVSVGRYHGKKGFDLIPEIAAGLKAKGVKFAWAVVGRGNEALEKKFPNLAELGVKVVPNVGRYADEDAFCLPSRKLIELYRSADVFAFPTLLETFGMVLVEAMAAALPIVTTDAPGVRDVITDGVDGVKAKAGDVAGFTASLADVLTCPERAAALSRGSAAAAERYGWDRVTQAYLDLYRDTIARCR